MVKKLFKHEFSALFRLWMPMHIILLAVALFGRALQLFEQESDSYDIIFGTTLVTYIVTNIAVIVLTLVFGITRFYKNLFTAEGYLSFTLPVTATQHILVKVLVAGAFMVGSFLMEFVSLAIFTFGESFGRILEMIGNALTFLTENVGIANAITYIAEGILLILLYILMEFLLYYFCIAIGQTFKKNRVAGAVAVYFIHYVVVEVLQTFILIPFTILLSTDFFEAEIFTLIGTFTEQHPHTTAHIVIWIIILFTFLVTNLYFFVTRYIMRNKLNLE